MSASYHTILVAFCVNAEDRNQAQSKLMEQLPRPGETIDCWWIAEDDRIDGSDNDSAVFVPMGMASQLEATDAKVLAAAPELLEACMFALPVVDDYLYDAPPSVDPDLPKACSRMLAAIDKAEGRMWIACKDRLPADGQEVWYYGPPIGVWRGTFTIDKTPESESMRHQWGVPITLFVCSEALGVVDTDDAPYWMPITSSSERPRKPADT